MRIALVHMRHGAIGGTELVLHRLSRHLAERGHEVTIVCRSHVEPSHPALRFRVLRSPALGSAWRMWAFAQDVERHVRAGSYDLVLGLGKTWSQDVVRASGGSHATYLAQMRRSEGGGWRDSRLWRAPKDRLALEIERRAYAPGAYRRVIANSSLVRADLCRRYGVPPEVVEVVYNGVDLERFHPRLSERAGAWRRSVGLRPEELVFLFLGQGFARKGLTRALRAFAEVAERAPAAKLVVVGRDSSQARYERLAAELSLSGHVLFLGQRRDPELCLAACDVHVLPTWYDSFGFTVLEALASGKPAITTAGAGAAELVEPGLHGAVLDADCGPTELARAMLEWTDRERARSAAAPARARAEQYGFDATISRLGAVLEDVGAERSAAREA